MPALSYALGKWDHTPLTEVSQSGPFTHWASGEGFDHFYGFMAADADDFRSLLWADYRPTENWLGKPGYHLTTDLADKAIDYLTSHASVTPEKPFFMFWAPSAMHSPHQVEQKYIDMYKGKFDMGWDKARDMSFKADEDEAASSGHQTDPARSRNSRVGQLERRAKEALRPSNGSLRRHAHANRRTNRTVDRDAQAHWPVR